MRPEDRTRILHMIEAASPKISMARKIAKIRRRSASKVSPETRADTAHIPWPQIVAMRHRLIHAYFDVNRNIIWKTAIEELPALVPALRQLVTEKGRTQ